MQTADVATWVAFQTDQGLEVRGRLKRMSRYAVVFEVYGPEVVLRVSEVLRDFKVASDQRVFFQGKAVLNSVVNLDTMLLCEVTLEDGWQDLDQLALTAPVGQIRTAWRQFSEDWQKFYRVLPEFKLLIGDIHTFLAELRQWLNQLEMGLRTRPGGESPTLERDLIAELAHPVVPALNAMFEHFEQVAAQVPPDMAPAHHVYLKRHLHPLMLCAPFAHRTFAKPLGYAGDYEMVNMILRRPEEGASLYAKLLNVWFLRQPPAEAHRNRIRYLTDRLVEETARIAARSQTAQIFNLGCGPASEIQAFLDQHHVSNHARFTLVDFNDETVAYAHQTLSEALRRHQRRAEIQLVKKSAALFLKGASRGAESGTQYDYVYCAGLFDYLPDSLCKQLMNAFYGMLAPGGLLVATNVDASNPIQHMLDYVLEWHLIYRNGPQLLALAPDRAQDATVRVQSDITGVNLFLEVRKPNP